MPAPRIDDVATVEVGRWYSVPTCYYPWLGRRRWWPTIGPLHEDAKWIGFPHIHYHVDGRFVNARDWAWMGDVAMSADGQVAARPLMTLGVEHGPLVWRRMRCKRRVEYAKDHDWRRYRPEAFPRLAVEFSGVQCKRSGDAWLCPHKGARLTMPAEPDGVVVCPLHGLRIESATGRVLAPSSAALRTLRREVAR